MTQNVLNLFPIDYPFETLIDRVNRGSLILDPEFQRKYKWNSDNEEKPSRFIESCLMRIPLPACYFAENEEKKHLVIDGVQRITTIKRFLNNEFALEGLTAFSELEGKKFSEIGDFQEDLNSYTIRCIILRNDNSQELIQDIFARLNQGAVELTDQEIRHAIFPGALNELITELAKHDIFDSFGKKNKDGLENEEQVLRFFAMQGDLGDYGGKLSKYLDAYMRDNQNINSERYNNMKELFTETLNKCISVFGDDVFMDITRDKPRRSVVYYDLLMWSFQSYELDFIKENQSIIMENFRYICQLDEFQRTLSGGLQRKTSILRRRQLWQERMEALNG